MATQTVTADKALRKVQKTAQAKCKPDAQKFGPMSSGDYARQGDVYIICLPGVPRGAAKVDKPIAQVAEGTAQGSRHILASLDGLTFYRLETPTVLDGPVINASKEFCLTHPEHGDLSFAPGVYQIGYQRQYAEELRRVAD